VTTNMPGAHDFFKDERLQTIDVPAEESVVRGHGRVLQRYEERGNRPSG